MPPRIADRIVDATLEIADEHGWDAVRLYQVADRLGLSLERIYQHYPDLDAVANAWLIRADQAMLAVRKRADFKALPAQERLYAAMMAWFGVLGTRRRVLRAILLYKLAPAHIHLQAAAVVATSRRVQWLREAAALNATGTQKSVEEVGLTALFVATLAVWLGDASPEIERTRRFLQHRLNTADRLMARLF